MAVEHFVTIVKTSIIWTTVWETRQYNKALNPTSLWLLKTEKHSQSERRAVDPSPSGYIYKTTPTPKAQRNIAEEGVERC